MVLVPELNFTRARTEAGSGHFPKHEEISSPFPQEEDKERPSSWRTQCDSRAPQCPEHTPGVQHFQVLIRVQLTAWHRLWGTPTNCSLGGTVQGCSRLSLVPHVPDSCSQGSSGTSPIPTSLCRHPRSAAAACRAERAGRAPCGVWPPSSLSFSPASRASTGLSGRSPRGPTWQVSAALGRF